jgi:hypothetical protein
MSGFVMSIRFFVVGRHVMLPPLQPVRTNGAYVCCQQTQTAPDTKSVVPGCTTPSKIGNVLRVAGDRRARREPETDGFVSGQHHAHWRHGVGAHVEGQRAGGDHDRKSPPGAHQKLSVRRVGDVPRLNRLAVEAAE